ncbi:MAG TPA: hypothetical protein VK213_03555 [Bacteroidales bacterium]|nr:hypothetical protein [Bacteroidales bacterium]
MKFLKNVSFLLVFALFSATAYAPVRPGLDLLRDEPVNPFRELIYAVGMVETGLDTLAYNPLEEAAGYFQIRPVRLDDYNKRTGSRYSLKDMYNYRIAEKIFLYYAEQTGPYDFEKIAKSWNGSGSMTIDYWNKVKYYLAD